MKSFKNWQAGFPDLWKYKESDFLKSFWKWQIGIFILPDLKVLSSLPSFSLPPLSLYMCSCGSVSCYFKGMWRTASGVGSLPCHCLWDGVSLKLFGGLPDPWASADCPVPTSCPPVGQTGTTGACATVPGPHTRTGHLPSAADFSSTITEIVHQNK